MGTQGVLQMTGYKAASSYNVMEGIPDRKGNTASKTPRGNSDRHLQTESNFFKGGEGGKNHGEITKPGSKDNYMSQDKRNNFPHIMQ